MANDLRGNPWIIDTAAAATLHANNIFVDSFVFSEYTSGTADSVVIQDWRGRDLYTLSGRADKTPVILNLSTFGGKIRGIAVTTLSSGILAINLR